MSETETEAAPVEPVPAAATAPSPESPAEVTELRAWFEHHIKNSRHSQDTAHYNTLFQLTETMCAKLHSKYQGA